MKLLNRELDPIEISVLLFFAIAVLSLTIGGVMIVLDIGCHDCPDCVEKDLITVATPICLDTLYLDTLYYGPPELARPYVVEQEKKGVVGDTLIIHTLEYYISTHSIITQRLISEDIIETVLLGYADSIKSCSYRYAKER